MLNYVFTFRCLKSAGFALLGPVSQLAVILLYIFVVVLLVEETPAEGDYRAEMHGEVNDFLM